MKIRCVSTSLSCRGCLLYLTFSSKALTVNVSVFKSTVTYRKKGSKKKKKKTEVSGSIATGTN